ncbi:HD-GYP domain-containing protein [Bacillaceae bacterium IKA-2]|nr:HD-GYP domain-containing protein [Bacillaceae bacterium IKA-2]
MIGIEKKLHLEYFNEHRHKVTKYLFWVNAIFFLLSSSWNILFLVFDLPYSRANIPALLACLGVLILVKVITDPMKLSSKVTQLIMLIYCAGMLIVVYFESGYSESWSFFLIVPLIAGLYGERKILFYYSLLGLFIISYLSINSPKSLYMPDNIDIANRILVYLIIASLSFLVLMTLNLIHTKQVRTVISMMENTIKEVVNSFVVSVEAKDQYTFGHSQRVSLYAVALAKHLPEYQESDLKRLRLAGLVHDIGKINIPEAILTNTGKLTPEEYEVIKTHTVLGARMIERIDGLQELKSGVLYHHERWDGKGYPASHQGKEIPLDARILAIADAFDAMTSDRSYRSGVSLNEALQRLTEGKGSQFDPDLIDVFEKRASFEFIKIYKASNDEVKEFETLLDFV